MGWILENLVKLILETVNDLLAVCLKLYNNIHLDIGYKTKNGMGLFDKTFPGSQTFIDVFLALGIALAIGILILKSFQLMLGPLSSTSDTPFALGARGILGLVLVSISYNIFVYFEKFANTIYNSNFFPLLKNEQKNLGKLADKFEFSSNMIKKDEAWTNDLAFTFLLLLLGLALFLCVFKLTLEIFERYVLLGVLFYTCPIAFATITSKDTENIFKSWVQMVISQFFILIFNLFVFTVFSNAIYNLLKLEEKHKYMFDDANQMITSILILIAILILGQKIDQHLRDLGLSVGQTGGNLAGEIIASYTILKSIKNTAKSAFKAGKSVNDMIKGKYRNNDDFNNKSDTNFNNNEPIDNSNIEKDDNGNITQEGITTALNSPNSNITDETARDIATSTLPDNLTKDSEQFDIQNGLITGYSDENCEDITMQAGPSGEFIPTEENTALRSFDTSTGDKYVTPATNELVSKDAESLAMHLNNMETSNNYAWQTQENGTVLKYAKNEDGSINENGRVYGQAAPDYLAQGKSMGEQRKINNVNGSLGNFSATVQNFPKGSEKTEYQGTISNIAKNPTLKPKEGGRFDIKKPSSENKFNNKDFSAFR